MMTFRLDIMTHCANIHIPVDIMSNIKPFEFKDVYSTLKFIMAKKNDDGKLYFEITTKDATYLGVPFTAIVKFTQN